MFFYVVGSIGDDEMGLGEIKERGVYLLPDGREVIASGGSGVFKLNDALAWKNLGPPLSEIHDGKHLTCFGRPTPWRVAALIDQQQTASVRPVALGDSK